MQRKWQTIMTEGREALLSEPEAKTNVLCEVVKENQMHSTFNRPQMMNSISLDMFFTLEEYVKKANELEEVKYIVIRGSGGNFSTGNDLNNFSNEKILKFGDTRVVATWVGKTTKAMCDSLINSEKPIFSIVDGKAIGFGFTQLGIYDRNFVTEKSAYMAPLVKLAQGPEMCSSYTFPKVFGMKRAEEILVEGKWVKAKELESVGLATCHKDEAEAEKALQAHIAELEELDWASYINARRLMRSHEKKKLLKANEAECLNLIERWCNEDLPSVILRYMANRKNNKPKL